jgi:hypothetical protein
VGKMEVCVARLNPSTCWIIYFQSKKKKKKKKKDGPEGYRSPYLFHAKEAFYHVNYRPNFCDKYIPNFSGLAVLIITTQKRKK